jgi:hypothetical protein
MRRHLVLDVDDQLDARSLHRQKAVAWPCCCKSLSDSHGFSSTVSGWWASTSTYIGRKVVPIILVVLKINQLLLIPPPNCTRHCVEDGTATLLDGIVTPNTGLSVPGAEYGVTRSSTSFLHPFYTFLPRNTLAPLAPDRRPCQLGVSPCRYDIGVAGLSGSISWTISNILLECVCYFPLPFFQQSLATLFLAMLTELSYCGWFGGC